jgi:uncharacterized protein (DUF2252 family)
VLDVTRTAVRRRRSTPRLSVKDRVAHGKEARASASLLSHSLWDPPPGRVDPVEILEDQARSRVQELVPIRYGRMMASPFAFYRGAAAIMASDLTTTPTSGIRTQLCGDAHLSNFGGFASPDRDLIFSINDFDETLPGPWEWDVKRLAASFAVAARGRGFTRKIRRSIITGAVRQYREAMREFAGQTNLEVWYARLDLAGVLARWERQATPRALRTMYRNIAKARTRDSVRAFSKLATDVEGRPGIIAAPPLVVPIADLLSGDELREFKDRFADRLQRYERSLPNDRRHLLDQFEYADFARKVVGVGSVGTRAWIVLLIGRDGGDPLFLQVKEAQESVLAPYAGKNEFDTEGQRVVEGQRLMQSASDIFLGWLRNDDLDGVDRDFYVRQLWDWKLSADIETMEPSTLGIYGQACGWTLARAHARSGDRFAITGYLGSSAKFETAVAEFAETYADQNERDHQALLGAIKSGRITAEQGV